MQLPDSNERFECCQCGACCTNIRKLGTESRKQRVIFRAPDDSEIGLPLWQWETEQLQRIADERNINVIIEPLQFFFDKKSQRAVIVSWHLNHGSCVFYRHGECTVYENRPHVCRMFPLIRSDVFEFKFGRKPEFTKTLCNADSGQKARDAKNAEEFAAKMKAYYGNSFDVAVQNDFINYFIVTKIKELAEKRIIDPIVSPRELALRRFEKSGKIGFFDLLKENGADTEQLIASFRSLRDAKSLVE